MDAVLSWASGNHEVNPGGPGDPKQVPASERGVSGLDEWSPEAREAARKARLANPSKYGGSKESPEHKAEVEKRFKAGYERHGQSGAEHELAYKEASRKEAGKRKDTAFGKDAEQFHRKGIKR